jgi:hypothetical protein
MKTLSLEYNLYPVAPFVYGLVACTQMGKWAA